MASVNIIEFFVDIITFFENMAINAKIDNIFASQLSESTYREVCREEIDNNHLPEDAFSQIDALMKARQVEKVQKRQTTEE